eukprot:scaffold79185_cov75-Cyclotella_meneghiniana.AAC.1
MSPSSSPPRKKRKQQDDAIQLHDLPTSILHTIFSFFSDDYDDGCWPLKLRSTFCRECSSLSRTFAIVSRQHLAALAFYPDSFLRSVYVMGVNCDYSCGGATEGSVVHDDVRSEDTIDLREISRFHSLQQLSIMHTQLNGEYPFLFRFMKLRTLAVTDVPKLQFNLDMLSEMSLLSDIRFSGCDELRGSLDRLCVLKDTLRSISIMECRNVTGDFMSLSEFPALEVLCLGNGVSVTGDARKLCVEHFPMLRKLELPDQVKGWKILQRISDADEIIKGLAPLEKRTPGLLTRGHTWKLSIDSPDYYESIQGHPAPFDAKLISKMGTLGWRWTAPHTYPPFAMGYWDVDCETHWIDDDNNSNFGDPDSNSSMDDPDSNHDDPHSNMDDPDSNHDDPHSNMDDPDSNDDNPGSNPHSNMDDPDSNYDNPGSNHDDPYSNLLYSIESFESVKHKCSSHLEYGRRGVPLIPYSGLYEPPTEEQYHQIIKEKRFFWELFTQSQSPDFQARLPLYRESLSQHIMSIMESESARNMMEAESAVDEEDTMSDLIDFEIDDIHTTTDADRQLNIIGTFVLSENNEDPRLTWRALWSIEMHHDIWLGGLRWNHFQRWPREAVENDPYRDKDSLAIYFPGRNASHDAKCCWAGMLVEECVGNDLRPAFDDTWERDFSMPPLDEAPSIISDILLACAPDKLSVCLYIDRSKIESFIMLATVQEDDKRKRGFSALTDEELELEEIQNQLEKSKLNAGLEDVKKFLSSSYIRNDIPSRMKINDAEVVSDDAVLEKLRYFKQWLVDEASSGGTLHQEGVKQKLPPRRYDELGISLSKSGLQESTEPDLVLLARMDDVPKGKPSDDVLDDMISSLGLHKQLVSLRQSCSRNPDIHGYSYITSDLIGGNIHYPDVEGRTSVTFTWTSTQKLTERHLEENRAALAFETDFVRNANAAKESSDGGVCFLLWPKHSNRDRGGSWLCNTDGFDFPPNTDAITEENATLIWLPADFERIEDEIRDELLDTSSGIRFVTTHSVNIFWQSVLSFFEREIERKVEDSRLEEYASIQNLDSLRFCHLLALTRILIEEGDSSQDTDYSPEDIKLFFDSLSNEWRSILSKSDEVLGLGLDRRVPDASREGLYCMLGFYEAKFGRFFYDMSSYLNEDEDDDDEEDEDEEDGAEERVIRFAPFPPHNIG